MRLDLPTMYIILFVILFTFTFPVSFSIKSISEFFTDSQKKIIVTCFVASWCPYSPDFLNNVRKAVDELRQVLSIDIDVIDCDAEPEKIYEKGIRMLPTMQVRDGDNFTEYEGAFTTDAIQNFILFFHKAYGK